MTQSSETQNLISSDSTEHRNGRYALISLVGRQVYGTINTILSILSGGYTLSTVYLLPTGDVVEEAEAVARFCREKGIRAEIHTVDRTVSEKGASADETAAFYAELHAEENERCFYNVDGGLNSMNVALLYRLIGFAPILLQVTDTAAFMTDSRTDAVYSCPLTAVSRTEDILKQQGVAYQTAADVDEKTTLLSFLAQKQVRRPKDILRNVVISGIRFDVWNTGNNTLSFLYDGRKASLAQDRRIRLAQIRDVCHFAQTRERAGQLYNRKVYVYCNDSNVIDHFRSEGGDKIVLINACSISDVELRTQMARVFSQVRMQGAQELRQKQREPVQPEEDTLVVTLGTDPNATLIAILTHRPKHVLLFCTEELRSMAKAVEAYCAAEIRAGVRTCICGISGQDMLSYLPTGDVPDNVIVNTSPGTKGHGAHLALWAARCRIPLWCIVPESSECRRLDAAADPLPLVIPDAISLLRIKGKDLRHAERNEEQKKPYDALLDFLTRACEAGRDADCFLETVSIGDTTLEVVPAGRQNDYVLRSPAYTFRYVASGGEWFEHLTARAFERAGARDVYVRVRYRYSEKSSTYLEKKYQEEVFVRDMDVLGSLGASHFLVSCKTNRHLSLSEPAHEAVNMASDIERFTVSFLAHLFTGESSLYPCHVQTSGRRKSRGVVRVIGWRDLCHPERLVGYCEELRTRIA